MCAIPMPWHIQAWNTGTCLYMMWTGLGCLNLFINSVVWNGNAINWAPVWCDISSKFIVGLAVAIPASSLCINRRLYHIACIRVVTSTKSDRRRAIMVDLAIGLGIPVLAMILHFQTTSFKVIDLTSWKTLVASLPLLLLARLSHQLLATCNHRAFFPPPTPY